MFMSSLNLENLRLAVITARYRSLHKAAEILRLRQSTLSRRLHDLEDELGIVLFERSKGGTHPTEAGLTLIETARRVLTEIDDAVVHVKSLVRGESGHLVVGVGAAVSSGGLTALLSEYLRRFPHMNLVVVDQAGGRPISETHIFGIDIAILTGGAAKRAERSLSLWTERVVAALPESHPLSTSTLVRWSDLANERLVVSRRVPELSILATAKGGRDGRERILEQDVGLDALSGLVKAGLGIALIVEGVSGAFIPGVVFREIHDDNGPARLPFIACWHRDNRNPALKPFLDLLRERYPDLSGSLAVSEP